MQTLAPFHLAVTVRDLEEARGFYGTLLECPEGRSSSTWVDFNFFGHQFVVHQGNREEGSGRQISSLVDDRQVPVPHFGMVLGWEDWERLAARLKSKNVRFVIEPYIRFKGEVGEQATMFLQDPSGNSLEFKSFKNPDNLFAK